MKAEAKKRIEKLKKVINHHRYLYHVLDKQEISDAANDSLKKELFDLEKEYPELLTLDSPTQRVSGKPLDKFRKKTHQAPMLSLNDAFSKKEMIEWEERLKRLTQKKLNYYCELKVDGLAVSLIYKKGVFVIGSTRGDGVIGEDVTFNLKTIDSIPLRLERKIDCEVRGEVYIKKNDFKKINKDKKYANPRNLAAGSIRQLDPKIARQRKLSFLAWQLLDRETGEKESKELEELGFRVSEGKYCSDIDAVYSFYEEVLKKRNKLSCEIDGIVVSINSNSLFEELGVAGKAPRASIALKFPAEQSTTIVLDIKIQVGRTGSITPVAVLKPITVGGVTVSRATLHNQDEIKRLGVMIKDTVIVERAGDVIPKVVEVLKDLRNGNEKKFKMPKRCPVCGTLLQKEETVIRCLNKKCKVRERKQLYHFVSKKTFNIDGLGPKIIDALLEQGLIASSFDLFYLKKGDLVFLEGFQDKLADNIIMSIEKAKDITLSRFIFSLGIRGVGEETARDLAFHFKTIGKFKKAKEEELLSIKDIGKETATEIGKKDISLIDNLLKAGIRIKKEVIGNKLKGKTFVLTGTLKNLSRDEAKQKIRSLGGDISSSVSVKTDFVVTGDNPGLKFQKAKKLKVQILKEEDLIRLWN